MKKSRSYYVTPDELFKSSDGRLVCLFNDNIILEISIYYFKRYVSVYDLSLHYLVIRMFRVHVDDT